MLRLPYCLSDLEILSLVRAIPTLCLSCMLYTYSVRNTWGIHKILNDLHAQLDATRHEMDYETARAIQTEMIPVLTVSCARIKRQLLGMLVIGVSERCEARWTGVQ